MVRLLLSLQGLRPSRPYGSKGRPPNPERSEPCRPNIGGSAGGSLVKGSGDNVGADGQYFVVGERWIVNNTDGLLGVCDQSFGSQDFTPGKKAVFHPVEVKWEAKPEFGNVDDHRDPWTNAVVGKRIFPDATQPDGEMRRELKVKVKIDGFANETVYLKVFDVDDPSAIPDPQHKLDGNDTDTNKVGDDNIRGAGLLADWGFFLPQQAKNVAVTLDSDGKAEVEFKVNQQPGNNYRVAMALKEEDLSYLQVADVNAEGYVTPDDKAAQGFKGGISSMLTVSRKLQMEVDSMNAPPAIKPSPDRATATGNHWGTDATGNHVLHLSSTLPEGNDFYGSGIIKAGSTELKVKGNDTLSITLTAVGQNPTQAQLDSCIGLIEVFDDDDLGLPKADLPKTDLISTGVKDIYKRAYIDIVEISSSRNLNKHLDFELYVNDLVTWTSLNDKKDTHGDDWVGYWSHYIVAAYQPTQGQAYDPAVGAPLEGMTRWGGWFTYDFCAIYTESIREIIQTTTATSSTQFMAKYQRRLDQVVAHEIGHVPQRLDGHPETGLMGSGAPEYHCSPETLFRFRKTPSWGASW